MIPDCVDNSPDSSVYENTDAPCFSLLFSLIFLKIAYQRVAMGGCAEVEQEVVQRMCGGCTEFVQETTF